MHYFCPICGSDEAQKLDSDANGLKAVCAFCGPFSIDRQVLKVMSQGRKLNAAMMKKWITGKYDPDTNQNPLITLNTAVWAN